MLDLVHSAGSCSTKLVESSLVNSGLNLVFSTMNMVNFLLR